MQQLLYATTNPDKFVKVQKGLQPFGIEVVQHVLELTELQSFDGAEVVRQKAVQAFSLLHQPVLVSDDSWSISSLRGFPATNMKQCNHFLQPEDWLRLMMGVKDRQIFLKSYLAFAKNSEDVRIFSYEQEAYFLVQQQGVHERAPHLTVVAWKGETRSIAECIAVDYSPEEKLTDFWKEMADAIKVS